MKPFKELLQTSAEAHGHLCPGQVVGVRMAMLGCRLIGLDEPTRLDQIKKLIVYVEMDRCTADAVAHVTGVKLGRRSLKFVDYGIMAATFVNLETDRAYRILSTEESRDLAALYAPEAESKKEQQLDLFADRTSCHRWWANQFRLLLSSLAYILIESLRGINRHRIGQG